MARLHPLQHRLAAFKMLAPDTIKPLRRDLGIPHAFRINDEPRSFAAHPQTGGFRPHDREFMLLHARLQIFPSGETFLSRATIRAHAEKKMAPRRGQTVLGESFGAVETHKLKWCSRFLRWNPASRRVCAMCAKETRPEAGFHLLKNTIYHKRVLGSRHHAVSVA